MSITLYHYVHCPFCVRVRMTLGFLNLSYNSRVLPYDDEETPVKLTGKKMLPILEMNGLAMNESLDIMAQLDQKGLLKVNETRARTDFPEFEAYLNFLGAPVHSLAMPYWIWTPEFNQQSRSYFQKKKEEKRGPFKNLVKNREKFIEQLSAEWPRIEKELRPFYQSTTLGARDILLASHLWGLYVIPEFQFPPAIHEYLQRVGKRTNFNYHADFWN